MLRFDRVELVQQGFTLRADWGLRPGARCAVIGPSGAGKSTLLAAISGFLLPRTGRILWQERDLRGVAPGDRPVTILFQDQNLFAHLSVAQNIGLGLAPNLRLSRAQHGAVARVIERVGLDGHGDRLPGQLSGGQISRVALARALLRARPLLLLDEPFAALGPGLKKEMLALLTDILDETGATLVMVTHDPADARAVSDVTVMVDRGVAATPVATEALFSDPPEGLRAYLGQ